VHEILIVVCFIAAIALAVVAYFLRDSDWEPLTAVLLSAGTLFSGVALLLDDWVIVVALAAGAVTAFVVTVGGFGLADRLQSSEPGRGAPPRVSESSEPRGAYRAEHPEPYSAEQFERWRQQHEYAQQEAERQERERKEVEARIAAAAAGLRSESLDDRFTAVSELAVLSGPLPRDLLAGHVRIRARGEDERVSPDVEAALAALGRDTDHQSYSRAKPVNLARAHLRGLVLADADLRGAVLSCADLEGALLDQVNLAGARLRGANLRGVRFDDVDLSGASLSGADLSGATLELAGLSGATYDETTKWPKGFQPAEAVVRQS
jgi:Pentapeptide repeats (8 copies)